MISTEPDRNERFNTCTHGAGLVLAVIGAAWLLWAAAATQEVSKVVGAAIFAGSMVAMYAASTLCHGTRGALRRFWELADHGAIFLLIAGTYTPFALSVIETGAEWLVFGAVWCLAIVGVGRLVLGGPASPPPLGLYLALGWLATGALASLAARLSDASLALLLAGAAIYTAGTWFYRNVRQWRHAHGVWHLFVVAGTASHFAAAAHLVA